MKKIFIILSVALVALASCQKEEFIEGQSAPAQGSRITFCGEAFSDTKTTIGAKDGNTYPVLWAKGDKIGIFSQKKDATDTLFQNSTATLYGEGGSNSGIFVLDEEVDVKVAQNVVIYYPRTAYTKLNVDSEAGVTTLTNSIPMEQKQLKADDNSYTGKYALAFGTAVINPAVEEGGQKYQEPVKFTLKHNVAYVKLHISSSNYSSLKLAGASLWAKDAAITGDIAVNISTGEIKNVTPRSYAVVTVEEPSALSAAQDLWLVTLPVDLTGKDVYVSVSMTDGTKNTTIPVKVNGGQLKANTVNVINVAAETNPFSWYQPEETRFLAEAYAYGAENTIMVTNADAPIVFDVKARGYFIGCAEPKYVWMARTVYGNTTPKLKINGSELKDVDLGTDATVNDCATITDGTITLDYTGTDFSKTTMAGKIIIADKDLNTIWAFNLWHVAQYNSGVVAHTYKCGKQVMDRYLGSGYEPHSYDNWHAMGIYFQWGRPFGFGWGKAGVFKVASTNCTDIYKSASLAETILSTNNVQWTRSDWYLGEWTNRTSDAKNDAWGNPANADEPEGSLRAGTKSVLDPCPKGWMVCSPDVLKEVVEANPTLQLHDVASTANPNGEWGKFVREAVYKFGTEESDVAYWRFDGLRWGSDGGVPANQVNDILAVYSNSSVGPNSSYVASIYYRSKEAQWKTAGSRNSACSVRCMKDTENR